MNMHKLQALNFITLGPGVQHHKTFFFVADEIAKYARALA
jgi:hypothetical protein